MVVNNKLLSSFKIFLKATNSFKIEFMVYIIMYLDYIRYSNLNEVILTYNFRAFKGIILPIWINAISLLCLKHSGPNTPFHIKNVIFHLTKLQNANKVLVRTLLTK